MRSLKKLERAAKAKAELVLVLEKKIHEQALKDEFINGFATAVAEVVRYHNNPTIAAAIIAGSGFTKADFKCVEPYDRNVIYKLFKTESILEEKKR